MKPTNQDIAIRVDELLNQFIVYGQKQQPFSCARCGAQTDDEDWNNCWCTDRDSSSTASSPTWIKNINYPRFAEARSKARTQILELVKETSERAVVEAVGENLPIEQPFDDELDTITKASWHIFRKGANWEKERIRQSLQDKRGGQDG